MPRRITGRGYRVKNETAFFYIFIAVVIAFLVGVLTGHGIGAGRIGELEARLADIEVTNTRLRDENAIASGIVADLTERIRARQARDAVAIGILDEIGSGFADIKDTVERAIRRVEIIETALSVLLDGWQD